MEMLEFPFLIEMLNAICSLKSTVPDVLGDRQWKGRQLWVHHRQQTQPCTCQIHYPPQEPQRPRHTCLLSKDLKTSKPQKCQGLTLNRSH